MAAPVARVFAAHASADHIRRWFGPVDYPVTQCAYDFQIGGRWRMVMTGPDGLDGPPFGGIFLEIVPSQRIVYTNSFEGGETGEMNLQHADEMVFSTTFAETAPGETTVTVAILFPSVAMKDEYLGVGMEEGIASSHDQWEGVARALAV
jgi:uncharacterized protein YndB with AHSA1/START domain